MIKKKVGIVTMYYGNANYGAILQAYALTFVINKMGFDCEQISFSNKNIANMSLQARIKQHIKNEGLFSTSKIVISEIKNKIKTKLDKVSGAYNQIKIRENAIYDFAMNDVPHSERVYSNQTISECNDYDIYVTGSDQVWRKTSPGYWLTFVDDNKTKISYAASMALDEIPKENVEFIRNALRSFNSISVREDNAKINLDEILLNSKQVRVVIDPTLLLTKDMWDNISLENPYKNEKYIFTYFLGDKKEDRKFVTSFAKKNNLKIINIPYLLGKKRACDDDFGDIKIFNVSPKLFISLIKDAQYVFTDSFHGTVFSCLMHTNFFVFKRFADNDSSSMNSRIYTLLEMVNCIDRLIPNNLNDEQIKEINEIDFKSVDEKIEKRRQESLTFLKDALGYEKEYEN